ncbi:hypothetical protein E2C01_028745 [Portunus trituberculatus]|uniref:Uncharacterized protein n=1 Tax=Portunus trituberculatus TaxID=210409 RepID=A0A5B7EQU4_PORTR|nr:hypothetical protein [Portunus trituberculatus]
MPTQKTTPSDNKRKPRVGKNNSGHLRLFSRQIRVSAQDFLGNVRLTKMASVGLNFTTVILAGRGSMIDGIHSVSHEIADGHEQKCFHSRLPSPLSIYYSFSD